MANDEATTVHESCMGYCSDCGVVHSLPAGKSKEHGLQVMEEFKEIRRLDYMATAEDADPLLSFDHLFPGDRGHMFGVLECVDRSGEVVVLRAFSSLRGGVRKIDGWVPPIHTNEMWESVVLPTQSKIKELTFKLKMHEPNSCDFEQLFNERKRISTELVARVQDELVLTNFRGERRGLKEVHPNPEKIPGGVGDCCGPKLLDYAARHDLKPLGLSEFYWGESTPSGTKVQGEFYSCCREKCQPILGFMLCGIDELF